MTRLPGILAVGLLTTLAACEAGPSAFDRPPATTPAPSDSSADGGASVGAAAPAGPQAGPPPTTTAEPAPASDTPPTPAPAPGERLVFERPEHVRGIYLNAWASGSTRRVEALLELARRTEINSFVIDVKDASGYVSHHTAVPLAQEIGATGEIRIRDLPGLLRRLHAEGIYPIARIVIVQDPILAAARPDMAAQDKAGGIFKDGKGIVWTNPYDRRIWEYHVALAREVAEMGFPEIQWDYVRFPDIPPSDKARVTYPGAGDQPQSDAIRALLTYTREELADLGVAVTADVFGVTTTAARDVGIGQVWEKFIDVVDVALPMVYPSHYWEGSYGFKTPNAHPYEVVKRALEDALRRSAAVDGAGTTRPWLQDFTLGQPRYGAPEVRAQIQATYDVGIHEWILWNPGSRYTEEALEPTDGWDTEPLIRVAGQVVPVSRRMALLDSVAGGSPAGDTLRARAGSDGAGPIPPDTTGAVR